MPLILTVLINFFSVKFSDYSQKQWFMLILIMDRHSDIVLNGFPHTSNQGIHATLKLDFRNALMEKNSIGANLHHLPSQLHDCPIIVLHLRILWLCWLYIRYLLRIWSWIFPIAILTLMKRKGSINESNILCCFTFWMTFWFSFGRHIFFFCVPRYGGQCLLPKLNWSSDQFYYHWNSQQ